MKKILTITFAIFLALLLVWGASTYRRDGNLDALSFNGLTQWFTEWFKDDSKPRVPQQATIENSVPEYDEFVLDTSLNYEEHITKGDHFFERGFLNFASNEYAAAAQMEPQAPEAHLKLMQTNYALRDYKKALNNADVILTLRPNDFETKLLKARSHVKLIELEQAGIILDSLASGETTDARVLYNQGLIKAALRLNQEAKTLFQKADQLTQDDELKEKIRFFTDSFAEHEFSKGTDDDYLYTLIARAFNKAEEYELAIEVLRETLKQRTDLRDAWILFGFAYLNLEQYEFSRTAFERAYQLDAQWPTTQYFLGLNHKELENVDEAVVFFNYALNNRFEPSEVIHGHLADLYYEKGDYGNAVKSYEKVLELSNNQVDAFVRPIWLYLDFLDQPQDALALAQVAVTSFPESAMAHNLLGWSLTGAGNYQQAEQSLLKSLELASDLPAAKYNLANLYKLQNRVQEALPLYQEAYTLDQNGSIGNLAAQAYNELLNPPEPEEENQD